MAAHEQIWAEKCTPCTCSHILYFYKTATWNHFILYMHISLGGLFNICENGGGGSMRPLKNYGGFCVLPLNAFNYITI